MTYRNSLPLCIVLLTAMLAASASTEAVKLPDSALTEDTFLVVTWDTALAKPADGLALVNTVVRNRMEDLQEPIARYKASHERLAGAGLASASLIYRSDPDKTGKPAVLLCLRLAPGADRAKLENAVKAEGADRGLADWDVASDGDFLLLRPRGAAKGARATAARRALFDAAVGRGDKALSLVFIPTEAMQQGPHKDAAAGEFPEVAEVQRLLTANAKWLRLDLDMGASAAFEATAQAKDAAGAGRVAEAFKKAAETLKSQTNDLRTIKGFYGALADGIPTLIDDMAHPAVAESRLGFTAKGKSLGGVGILLDLALDPLMNSLPTGGKQ